MLVRLIVAAFVAVGVLGPLALAGEPIAIESIDRATPVDFQTEVLPILRANCLACHNASQSEGELNLETPATIVSGGSQGPAVVPHQALESLLLNVAAHRQESFMPPADNDVAARALTPAELGLIKLWIDQGAGGSVAPLRRAEFRPLPGGVAPIFAAAVTGDGQFAACARGQVIDVYHVASGQRVARLEGHLDVVHALAFDSSGQWLASGGYRQVKLWRRPHAAQLAAANVDRAAAAVAISADAKQIAIGTESGQIQLLNPAGEVTAAIDAHSAAVTGVAFSPDATRLVSTSADKTVCITPLGGGDPPRTFETPAAVNCMTLVHDGKYLVTGHDDHVLRVWDLSALPGADEPLESRLELKGHEASVTAIAAWPSQADAVVSASADGAVRLWNAESGEQLRQWNHGDAVTALAVRADGQRMASASATTLKLWHGDDTSMVAEHHGDPRAHAAVAQLEAEIAFTKSAIQLAENDIKSYEGAERRVKTTAEAVKKAEDEELAKAEKAITEKQEALAKAKEKGEEKAIERAEKELAEAQTARGVAMTIIERAKVVANRAVEEFAEAQAAVKVDQAKLEQFEKDKTAAEEAAKASLAAVRSLAFTADHRQLLAGRDDGGLMHYDATLGHVLKSVAIGEHPLVAQAASAGLVAVVAADGRLQLDRFTGEWRLAHTIGAIDDPSRLVDRVNAIAFDPSGELLAVGGGLPSRSGELKLFHTANGQLVREIPGPFSDTVLALAFSPDGARLASAGADSLVSLFDVNSGERVQSLAGHTAHVTGVSFSGDGKWLVTSGGEHVLKLWDLESGAAVRTMKGTTYRIGPYRREVTAVQFIGASEQILAASGDGTVRLHRISSDNDILTFSDSSGYIYCAAASRDGHTLVAGGADGVLWLWSGHDRSPKASFPPAP